MSGRKEMTMLPLAGAGSIVGRGVVLHSNKGDCETQPTGNSGSRLAFCVVGIANGSSAEPDTTISSTSFICHLKSLDSNKAITGRVWIEKFEGSSFQVQGGVEGLVGDPVGFHMHQYGDMSDKKGISAGAHFNPSSSKHGLPHDSDRHFGDLGNIRAFDENGKGWYSEVLNAPAGYSIYLALGRAIVVHSAEDDGCTQPTGNAGSRLAICVIGLANPKTERPQPPNGLEIVPQVGSSCQQAKLNPGSNMGWAILAFIAILILAVGFMYTRSSRSAPAQECLPDPSSEEREKLK
jgi:superoxide dismutase, Cu-Zn family